MPTYVYECNKCGDEFELYQSFSDEPLKKHPECGGKVAKVFQPVGIVLKGSGFYKNDSRGGAKRANGSSSKTESTSDNGSKEGSKSESSSSDSSSTKTDTKKSESSGTKDTKKKSDSSTSSAKSS